MDILILILAWSLSVATLFLVFQITRSKRHGCTVSVLGAPSIIVALAFFCVGIPKFTKLFLDWGERKIEISRLDEQIQEKKEYLTKLNRNFPEGQSIASIQEENGQSYVMSFEEIRKLLPEVKVNYPDKVIIDSKELNSKTRVLDKGIRARVLNRETGKLIQIELTPQQTKTLIDYLAKKNKFLPNPNPINER